MKKLIGILIAAVLIATAFAACTNAPGSSSESASSVSSSSSLNDEQSLESMSGSDTAQSSESVSEAIPAESSSTAAASLPSSSNSDSKQASAVSSSATAQTGAKQSSSQASSQASSSVQASAPAQASVPAPANTPQSSAAPSAAPPSPTPAVPPAAGGIVLDKTSPTLDLGQSVTVTANGFPNSVLPDVKWTATPANAVFFSSYAYSGDMSKATFHGTTDGSFVVTVATSDGSYSASLLVTVKASSVAGFADEVIRLINIERAKAGKSALTASAAVAAAADIRAREIVQTFAHTRPDGTSCFTALSGVSYVSAGENIAEGQTTPAKVVQDWMDSPGHKANILTDAFNTTGVGVYYTGGKIYWAQIFIQTK